MAKISLSNAWEETKAILSRDGKLVTSVALALLVLPQTISELIAPPTALSGEAPPSWIGLVALVLGMLGIAGEIAIVRLALGPSTSVGEAIALGFRRLLPIFLALLLFAVALALVLVPIMILIAGPSGIQSLATEHPTPAAGGALLLVLILGLLAAPRFQLVVPCGAAEAGGPIRLLRRSWTLTSGNYWRLLGFLLLVVVLAIVIVLFLGQIMVGVLVESVFGTVPPFSVAALVAGLLTGIASAALASVLSLMLARMYVQVAEGDARVSTPSTGI